jgi:glycosyltransferase involved in cell wall biosynthesis
VNSVNNAPLLSVTVLNYNYSRYLRQCLDSVLAQDFQDFELIIINDKSTDCSIDVIRPYLADSRVRLIDHVENKGFVQSLIEGSESSRGKYLTVVSADDWIYAPTAFSQQIRMLEADSQIAFTYSAYGHFSDTCELSYVWRGGDTDHVMTSVDAFKKIVVSPFLLHSGTIIRKTAYDAVGGYDASFRYSVDARLWLMLCHQGKVGYVNSMLYAYRRHDKNMSKNVVSFRRAIGEILSSIDASFDQLSTEQQGELRFLRRKAVQNALVAFAIDDIFRGWYSVGWRSWFEAVKMKPIDTVFQKNTIVLVLRTVLGRRLFEDLKRWSDRGSLPGRYR